MALSKEQRWAKVHDRALQAFTRAESSCRDERKQALTDRRFYSIAGAQWENEWGEMFENKPRPEVNKVHMAVMRIINEYRNNRITVDFEAKDGETDLDLADICDGLYRADEQDSCAEEAYDNAFEEGAGGGMGAWRLRACEEDEYDEDNERQRIRFEPVFDADQSVFFDVDAKRQDKSDAKKCWVIYSMDRATYEEEYNDSVASWPRQHEDQFDWSKPDVVYLAEYYEVEEKREDRVTFIEVPSNKQHKLWASEADEPDNDDIGENWLELTRKPAKRRRVRKYLMSGGKILEDQGYIAGKFIPIIPFYGKRWFVDNVERFMGVVRLSKDPQRIKNVQLASLVEMSSLSSIQKPIFTPEQMAGHAPMWSEDNIKNYPYLLINAIEDAEGNTVPSGPLGYTQPPSIPPALAALLQVTEQDMADILGRGQEGEKLLSNVSGDAIEMVQSRLDMQAFIYMSNFAKAMQHCGRVWLSMATELYVEDDRKMKSIGEQGNIETATLNQLRIDEKTGEAIRAFDISRANFDVAVDVGPSFSSRRDAVVSKLTNVLQNTQEPQTRDILLSMILMNMQGEGLGDIREYFRKKLVALGVVPPNEEERQAMEEAAANEPPNAEQEYLLAEAVKARAEAENKQADTVKKQAETEKIDAETIEILGKVGMEEGVTQ